MVNYKAFKIIRINDDGYSFIGLCLNEGVEYSDSNIKAVLTKRIYPFTTYQVDDWIEVDIDWTRYRKYLGEGVVSDTSVVRKVGSSAVVSSSSSSSTGMTIGSTTITRQQSLAVARELDAMVDQSGGTKEYTASIEVQDEWGKPIKFSLSSKKS